MPFYCEECGKEYAHQISAQLCKEVHVLIREKASLKASYEAEKNMNTFHLATMEKLRQEKKELKTFIGDADTQTEFSSVSAILVELQYQRTRNKNLVREMSALAEKDDRKDGSLLVKDAEIRELKKSYEDKIGAQSVQMSSLLEDNRVLTNRIVHCNHYLKIKTWTYKDNQEVLRLLREIEDMLKP